MVVRCFHNGSGDTNGTMFVGGGGVVMDFSDGAFVGLVLRSGLILGIGFVCCLVQDGKVGGEMFFHGGEDGVGHAVEVTEAVVNRFALFGVAIRFPGDEAASHGDGRHGIQGVITFIFRHRTPDALVLIPVFGSLPVDREVIATVEEREFSFNAAVEVISFGIHNLRISWRYKRLDK